MTRGQAARSFVLLGTLYAAQGLPFGFFSQALPVFLRQRGHSLEMVGMSSLLAAPWAFKFLWAPLVDRVYSARFGARRSWIVPLQLLSAALLFGLAAFPSSGPLTPLLIAVFLTNLLAATQDIATDALALDVLTPEQRGLGNGLQVAGYRVGMIFGGGAVLLVFDELGWAGAFGAMGALMLLLSLPIAGFKEPTRAAHATAQESVFAAHFLRRPDALAILVPLVTYKFGDAFALAMLRPLLVDRGLSLKEIGSLLGVWGFSAGLVGALAGGALVNRLGRKPALIAFGALQALSVAGYALLARNALPPAALYALTVLEHLAGGMATAALFTCMMDWCRPRHSASDYAVQASAVVIANAVAAAISGYSAHALGYARHFLLAALLSLLVLLTIRSLFARIERGAGVFS
jgi:MFS family permease